MQNTRPSSADASALDDANDDAFDDDCPITRRSKHASTKQAAPASCSPHQLDVLADHMTRVQHSFVEMVDAKNAELHRTLHEQAAELGHARCEHRRLLAEVGTSWADVEKANAAVAALRGRLSATTASHAVAAVERDANAAEAATMRAAANQAATALEEVRTALERAQRRSADACAVGDVLTKELRVERRVQARLRREYAMLRESTLATEAELSRLRRTHDRVLHAQNELSLHVQAKVADAATAQVAVSRMSNELVRAEATREEAKHMWSEAAKAMTRRDALLHAARTEKTLAQADAMHRANVASVCEREVVKKSAEFKAAAEALEHSRASENVAASAELAAKRKAEDLAAALESESRAREDAELAEKKANRARSAKSRKLLQCRKDLDEMRSKLETIETSARCAGRAEGAAKVRSAEEGRTNVAVRSAQEMLTNAETRGETLRQQLASLRLRNEDLELRLEASQKENDCKQTLAGELRREIENLREEKQRAEFELSKTLLEMNKMRREFTPTDTRPLENTITSLTAELSASRRNFESLQTQWLKVQLDYKNECDRNRTLCNERQSFITQINVMGAVKIKTGTELRDMERETFDVNMRLTKANLELQALRPKIAELNEKNRYLEAQLGSRNIQVEEIMADDKMAINMMKQVVQQANREKQSLIQFQKDEGKTLVAMTQRYELARVRLERALCEKNDSLEQAKALRVQNAKLAARLDDTKRKWKELDDIAKKSSHPAEGRHRRARSEESRAVGEVNNAYGMSKACNEYEIVDIPALRLRIETLQLEKQQQEGECVLSLRNIQDAERRAQEAEREAKRQTARAEQEARMRAEQIERLNFLELRSQRSEALAIFLEKQLRDSEPNRKIYYDIDSNEAKPKEALNSDSGGSTALMAALRVPGVD